jgi:hypothetical protein
LIKFYTSYWCKAQDILQKQKMIFCQQKQANFSREERPLMPASWEQGMGSQALLQLFEQHKGGLLHEPRALQM